MSFPALRSSAFASTCKSWGYVGARPTSQNVTAFLTRMHARTPISSIVTLQVLSPPYKAVGDITYLRIGQGWLCLPSVIDLNTRMVVGWSLSARMMVDIVVSALASVKACEYVAETQFFTAIKARSTLRIC